MFSLLQASRFFAALIVVLDHTTLTFGDPRYFSYSPFNGLFGAGRYGVDFFFVLSGFIICHAHWADIVPGAPDTKQRLAGYAKRRFIRIYPTYWVVLAITILPLYVMQDTRFSQEIWDPWYLLSIITLFQGNGNVVTAAWTLTHEVAFYLLFGLVIWRRAIGVPALAAWFCLSSLSFLAPGMSRILAHPEHIGFLIGMAGSYLVRTTSIPFPKILFWLGLTTFLTCCVATGYFHVAGDLNEIVEESLARGPLLPLMFSSLLMIIGMVEMERSEGAKAPVSLNFLGDASYSLYLLHFPVLVALIKMFQAERLDRQVPLSLLFVTAAAGAVIASLIFHVVVERPLLNHSKRWFGVSGGGGGPRGASRHRPTVAAAVKDV